MEKIVQSIPKWVKKDIAIEVMAEMLADQRQLIREEERKPNPDLHQIQQLYIQKRKLLKERKEMYFGNQEIIQKILIQYGEKVRQKYMEEK
ncbi:hypothetical protein [Hazenella coriacea]|uniref:Uncharacterized protein n=1 Tax=Hazenella coriacea TaxID=1179467 RepID=A0A4R3L2B3_9BACL|nr:hypothetical protein [Hazenella coriacea]TCS93589.1 hypothetical protein EDD58_10622 [Hazenella coriacea]